MKNYKMTLIFGATVLLGLAIIAISVPNVLPPPGHVHNGGGNGGYQYNNGYPNNGTYVNNEVSLGEYKSDLDKVIESYEGIIDRLMYMSGNGGKGSDLNALNDKLNNIDAKLTLLTDKISKIEDALKINTTQNTVSKIGETNEITLGAKVQN